MKVLLSILIGYALGSVSFGGIAGRMRGVDPRGQGTGRLGALNTGRALGLTAGVLVFAGDALKGTAAVWVAGLIEPSLSTTLPAGLAAVVGHLYPVFFRFRGGKGLATSVGVLAVLDYHLLFPPLSVAVGAFILARNIYVAALAGIFIFPFWLVLKEAGWGMISFGFALAGILIFSHRENIRELLLGRPREEASPPETVGEDT